MPPKGLYRIPQHHLTGQSASVKRQSFNTMDFKEAEKPAPITTNDGATDDVVDEERAKRKQEKREKKEQRRLKREAKAAKAIEGSQVREPEKVEEKQKTPPVDATPTEKPAVTPVKNGKYGPRGPYKKREIGPDGTPVSAAKKRKRESEAPVDSPAATKKSLAEADNWLGPNFRENLDNALSGLGSIFDQQYHKTATPSELPKKKPGRPAGSSKKAVVKSVEAAAPKASETTKKVVKSGESKPEPKKQKLENALVAPSLEKASKVTKTPVPVPSVASALPSDSKQTPVPLPQRSPRVLKDSVKKTPAKKTEAALPESEVLVTETPLSQMSCTPATTPRVPAIPFSLSQATSPAATTVKKTKEAPVTHESFPEILLPVATKLAKADKHIIGSQGSVNPLTSSQVDSLTSANLMRFKQPLNGVIITNESEAEKTSSDMTRTHAATTFLRYSILTRVPMPLGPIEGTWKLYCPKYTNTHVDKYGFGQRTLSISSIAGLNPMSGAYTARLCIPPRSLPYPIQAFEAPPHASFRTTVLKTVAEGYKMHVVFLGNGYLKLRVNVHLLLTGKTAAETKAGKGKEVKAKAGEGVWEFLGVNDKAVVWEPAVDELEKEGRKLVAKYDGR